MQGGVDDKHSGRTLTLELWGIVRTNTRLAGLPFYGGGNQ